MELALNNRRKAGLAVGAAAGFFLLFVRPAVRTRHELAPRGSDAVDLWPGSGMAALKKGAGGGAAAFGFEGVARGAAPSLAAGAAAGASPAPEAPAFARRMIREGSMTIEVATRGEARGRALEAARRLGADVLADAATEGGDGGSSAMTFAIEPARLSALVEALLPLGRVLTRETSAEDITEEWVDLDSRLANARSMRARLEELMRFKTSNLADVVLVERELERVGSEIERMEGRRKYLAARSDRARLCVRFQDKPKIATVPSALSRARASTKGGLDSAFEIFAVTTLALLQLAGFLLGLALWTVPVSLLGWKAWRRWAPKS